ncbi:MAG: phospholipase/carboxylesterase, partial [Kiritimatiellia bacterium]
SSLAYHGLQYIERVTGGAEASDELPLIVAVHGLGDQPAHFAWIFDGWDYPARIIIPAGPTPWGEGRAWMTIRTTDSQVDELAGQTLRSADRLAILCDELAVARPTRGKPVITGFSQGGMLAFTVAVHRPEHISGAVPVAGWLPEPLMPEDKVRTAPIRALHGEADQVLPFARTQRSVKALQALGADVQIKSYPGVPHSISRDMRADLFREIEALTSR